MKVADDLLARQQRVVAHVVNRDGRANRFPSAIKSKFTSRSPRLCFDTFCGFAEKRLLGRVDHPGSLTVELNFQVLLWRIGDRSANTLRRVIPSGDSYCVPSRIRDRFNLARFVELIEVAVRTASPHPSTASDTAGRSLHKVNRISRPPDTNDCPLVTELVKVTSPQNLCRSIWFRLQRVTGRFANVCKLVPRFDDVDSRGHHAIEHHAADLVFRDRFDGDPNATCVFILGRAHALDRCVANKAGQFHWPDGRIGQRRLKADDSANRNRGCR